MKFETNKPIKTVAYHGTQSEIRRFKISPDTLGQFTGNNGGAIFFTDNENVAFEYSKENYLREKENKIDYTNENWSKALDTAKEEANEKAFCYEVFLDIKKPLVLNIKDIENKNFRNISNVLGTNKLNHLINILQNRIYEKYMEFFDDSISIEVFEDFRYLFEDYDEELDEYIEKDYNYDCIIIEDCIDSINEDSDYMPSTIFAVLDDNIIKINKKIYNEE